MDIVTKKQLNILIQLAQADKDFAKVEQDMIYKIAQEKKYADDSVRNLITDPEPIDSLGALSTDQKFEYLTTCIDLIFADNKIFASELTFCKNVAIKLGFKKNVVDFMVESYNHIVREDLKKRVFAEFV
ncbi:MAG: TerB family tellurite resistance protein [Bacteroidia bacterium]|nr:TerB family tellurite resistance protein [Bacteroidia bacterium]